MSDLPVSVLGRTGETVTKLAYGAMELRGPSPGRNARDVSPAEAGAILNAVLDSGIEWRNVGAMRDLADKAAKCCSLRQADPERCEAALVLARRAVELRPHGPGVACSVTQRSSNLPELLCASVAIGPSSSGGTSRPALSNTWKPLQMPRMSRSASRKRRSESPS